MAQIFENDVMSCVTVNFICKLDWAMVHKYFVKHYLDVSGKYLSILCLSHHHILKAHNLSGFTSSQLERHLPQDKSHLDSHPHLI